MLLHDLVEEEVIVVVAPLLDLIVPPTCHHLQGQILRKEEVANHLQIICRQLEEFAVGAGDGIRKMEPVFSVPHDWLPIPLEGQGPPMLPLRCVLRAANLRIVV